MPNYYKLHHHSIQIELWYMLTDKVCKLADLPIGHLQRKELDPSQSSHANGLQGLIKETRILYYGDLLEGGWNHGYDVV